MQGTGEVNVFEALAVDGAESSKAVEVIEPTGYGGAGDGGLWAARGTVAGMPSRTSPARHRKRAHLGGEFGAACGSLAVGSR